MNIRPFDFTNADYTALLSIHQTLQPKVMLTIALLQEQDAEVSADNELIRVVGEIDNQVIAFGSYWYSPSDDEPHQFSLHVQPDFQNGTVPSQLHRYLLSKIEETQPRAIVSEPKENEEYRIQLLEADNFQLKMRFPRSEQSVNKLDLTKYDELIAQLEAQGIEFITLTKAMNRDAEWQTNVWRMFTIIDQDVPYPDPQKSVPFETYRTYYEGDSFRPDSWAIAWDSNEEGAQRYIGMSVVNMMATRPDALYAGITGVVPSHRRRRIATALKVCSAKYAREQGYDYIETDNEEGNPMLTLNLRLGFKPLPAWVYYEKLVG
ncbi:MAG: hypothetical protein ACPG8W_14145 [Candidatus Promineifilaceae bacterium]